ncbi:hypothetical protein AAGG49_21950, partial [Stenotrophomonas maltophilia]|uniref:hypothetical protein n=1 Tax=Stenotrophomonas maltophilia TaxID=40324 RepID=UPI00313AA7C8
WWTSTGLLWLLTLCYPSLSEPESRPIGSVAGLFAGVGFGVRTCWLNFFSRGVFRLGWWLGGAGGDDGFGGYIVVSVGVVGFVLA